MASFEWHEAGLGLLGFAVAPVGARDEDEADNSEEAHSQQSKPLFEIGPEQTGNDGMFSHLRFVVGANDKEIVDQHPGCKRDQNLSKGVHNKTSRSDY